MFNYIVRRVVQMIPLLFVISLIIFGITALQPGDPVDQLIMNDPKITPEDVQRLRESYGLDKPWFVRYWSWLMRALSGEFGYSQDHGIPVVEYIIQQRLPNTLLLTIPAVVIAFLLAVPLGIFSAIRQYTKADYILTAFSFIALSAPTFWVGVMAMYFFAIFLPQKIGLPQELTLPPGGLGSGLVPEDGLIPFWLDRLKYMILPVMILALRDIAVTMRYMRSSFLEVIGQDFVRTARAKGLNENVVIFKHALRNSLVPIITVLGLSIPFLVGGSVLTETVFAWPGMGTALLAALVSKDFNVVMVCLMIASFLTVFMQLVTDIVYALVDPRIRYT